MESGQLISDATTLMLLGMGTVFVFLTILVFITTFMSALLTRFAPEQKAGSSLSPTPVEDKTLIAVITAAIHEHRSRH